jgi:hypothetical protein
MFSPGRFKCGNAVLPALIGGEESGRPWVIDCSRNRHGGGGGSSSAVGQGDQGQTDRLGLSKSVEHLDPLPWGPERVRLGMSIKERERGRMVRVALEA